MKVNFLLSPPPPFYKLIVCLLLTSMCGNRMFAQTCDPACEDLSNLDVTTNINSHLLPDADRNLGSEDSSWSEIYLEKVIHFDEAEGYSNVDMLKLNSNKFLHVTGGSYDGLFLGEYAGDAASSSNHGTVGIGYKALETVTGSAGHNTSVGWYSSSNITSGGKNTMIGSRAGELITTGSSNIGIGQNTYYNNSDSPQVTGDGNIAIGGTSTTTGVLGNVTSGDYNVAIGYNSVIGLTEGVENTVIGYSAGSSISDGSNNIFVGSESGKGSFPSQSGNNNIVIGNNISVNPSTGLDLSNRLNIGNLLYGDLSSGKFSVGNSGSTLSNTFNVGSGDEFQVSSTGDLVRINDVGYTWPDDDGDANQVLQTDGSGNLDWETVVTDVQVFTGTTTLWAKPTGAVSVTVICIGGGGGGGSGGVTGDMSGGSGGGAGGMSEMTFNAANLDANVLAYAGAGGTGGAAVSSGDGKDGGNGTKSFFGDYLKASGGNGGNGGSSTGAAGGSGGPGLKSQGGSGASADPADQGDDAGNSNYASLGGGAGGGISSGGTAYSGGDGGGNIQFMNSSPAAGSGGTSGGSGGNGTAESGNYLGSGGGG
ncbi:MAG TPA: hypothetical protein P5512_04225, partial [Chitinophagales bacterium]|nr:hypothetical protein [Chitinophagales bacterium]